MYLKRIGVAIVPSSRRSLRQAGDRYIKQAIALSSRRKSKEICAAMKPSLWTPTAAEVKELQALLKRLESVTEMMTSEQNRLEKATPTVADLTLAHLEYLRKQQQLIKKLISDHFDQHPHLKQQRELLTSIPGLGDLTASVLLAEIGEVCDYDNARQLAAYAGLTQA